LIKYFLSRYIMLKKKLYYYQQPYVISKPFFKLPVKENNIVEKTKAVLNKPKKEISDSEGLSRAYKQQDKLYINNNKLYIAGTSSLRDVYDDLKIPFQLTRYSQRYKDAEKVLRNNPDIDTLIGHSLGSSVSLELNKNHYNKYKTRNYSSPVFDMFKNNSVNDKNLRFKTNYDIISMFDKNAINISKPSINPLNLHSYENYGNTGSDKGYQIM